MAIILGAVVLSDRITVPIVLGMLIVLAGVALTRDGIARFRRPDG